VISVNVPGASEQEVAAIVAALRLLDTADTRAAAPEPSRWRLAGRDYAADAEAVG